jgi:hypothetical protein
VKQVTWLSINDRVKEIAWEQDYDLNAGAFGSGNRAVNREKADAEAVMHELGHAFALRPNRRRFPSLFDTSKAIDRLSYANRDKNEILACAIEVACARLLGLTMSTRQIADYASDDMSTAKYQGKPGVLLSEILKTTETSIAKSCAERMKNLLLTPSSRNV